MTSKKSLACRELGVPECTFEVIGTDEDALKDAIVDHSNKYHSEKMDHMSKEDKKNLGRLMDEKLNRW